MQFSTRAIHIGNEPDKSTRAIVPPLHLSSTFQQKEAGKWEEYDYSRTGNPTRSGLEKTIASLEEGTGALAFSSGMATIQCIFQLLEKGDHLVVVGDVYGGTYRLLKHVLPKSGINYTIITSVSELEKACQKNTKLIWTELISNPLLNVVDIKKIASVAKNIDALLAIDSTFATPVLCKPLTLGADIVMHSATKYLGGHSDLLGGVLVVNDEKLLNELSFLQNATGAVMGSLECFLCSRGLKTLEVRVKEQCNTTLNLATFLQNHPAVKKAIYPGLSSHPSHSSLNDLFKGKFGSIISFEVANEQSAKQVVSATKLFKLAVSLGAVESLIEIPALMSHATYSQEDLQAHGISPSLIRLSVGLEAYEDLQQDLDQALLYNS